MSEGKSIFLRFDVRISWCAAVAAALLVFVPAAPAAAQIVVQSIAETGDSPTFLDNDFTRIDDAVQSIVDGTTIELVGLFDWGEPNARAAWELGSDELPATADDFAIVPPPADGVTLTAASLGAATILGPGDVPGVDLEGFLSLISDTGVTYQNWTISNLEVLDFDLGIGMFFGGGGAAVFQGTTIDNNRVRVATDIAAPDEAFQNIGIHFSFGAGQTISNNLIEIPGNGVSDSGASLRSASVGMQSNTSGGAYQGLQIVGNEVRILEAPSADPEFILGIWENGGAHNNDITVAGNRFVNLHPDNLAANNLQRAFRIHSQSSLASTVSYLDNFVHGANVGFEWISGFGGFDFSAREPVVVTGNAFVDNGTAVLVQSEGAGIFTCNRFSGNGVALQNDTTRSQQATHNWWGCNEGPGNLGCDPAAGAGAVVSDPVMVLAAMASPTTIENGGSSTILAEITLDADGFPPPACTLPDGIPVAFTLVAGAGTVLPSPVDTVADQAASTFTAAALGTATIDVTADGEAVPVDVAVEGGPVIVSLLPGSTSPGSPDTVVLIDGSGFVDGAVVLADGVGVATVFLSATQLQATLPAALLAAPRTIALRVRNPPPGGGLSNEVAFAVTAASVAEVPTLSELGLGLLALLVAAAAWRRLGG